MKKILAKVGTYTNKEGEEKNDYVDLGVILSNENGEYMLLDPKVNLAGVLTQQNMHNHAIGKKTGTSVMCSIFDRDNQGKQQSAPQSTPSQDFNDDIGF